MKVQRKRLLALLVVLASSPASQAFITVSGVRATRKPTFPTPYQQWQPSVRTRSPLSTRLLAFPFWKPNRHRLTSHPRTESPMKKAKTTSTSSHHLHGKISFLRNFELSSLPGGSSISAFLEKAITRIFRHGKESEKDRAGHILTNATSSVTLSLQGEQVENITTPSSENFASNDDENVSSSLPMETAYHDRAMTAAPGVDLSGTWKPIVTPQFKQEYSRYLQCCGEPLLKRNFYMTVLSLTGEKLVQWQDETSGACQLELTGTSPVGEWKRTLYASAPLTDSVESSPILTPVRDPDGDTVTVEAWWTNHGTIHESWMRDKPRVKGGAFQSLRYIEPRANDQNNTNADILVCESRFHPASVDEFRHMNDGTSKGKSSRFKPGSVKWRFERVHSR